MGWLCSTSGRVQCPSKSSPSNASSACTSFRYALPAWSSSLKKERHFRPAINKSHQPGWNPPVLRTRNSAPRGELEHSFFVWWTDIAREQSSVLPIPDTVCRTISNIPRPRQATFTVPGGCGGFSRRIFARDLVTIRNDMHFWRNREETRMR